MACPRILKVLTPDVASGYVTAGKLSKACPFSFLPHIYPPFSGIRLDDEH